MKRSSVSATLFLALFVFVLGISAPLSASAQYSSKGWSKYKSKINKLDDDAVTQLPIPILFGIKIGMITPNFGDPRDGGDRTHEGLDILAPKGAPIVSPTEAVVVKTGSGSGSGRYVSTANPGKETFVYMHLNEIAVTAGDTLEIGELIGYVGNTGNASGGPAHLHFEIRDGKEPTDPFLRITKEFLVKDKIEFLEDALESAGDEDELAAFVAKNYPGELYLAKGAGIPLPDSIEEALQNIPVPVSSSPMPPGDLTIGSTGSFVASLQGFLIAKNTGPAAEALGSVGITAYFGSLTQKALSEYQAAHNITPSSGYFGPKTRAYILLTEQVQ